MSKFWKAPLWWFWVAAFFVGFFLLYPSCLSFPPVFDDFSQLVENRAIRYLLHPRIFLESEYTRKRPLPYLTFALSYFFFGMKLSALRVWSLAFHLGNSVLVGLLFQKWFSRERYSFGALAAAALFLFHPLAVDTVVYFSARGSLMVLFFLLVALVIFSRERHGLWSLLGFFAVAGAAFLSRESAVALAPILVLAHLQSRRRHLELLPFLIPLVLGGLILLVIKGSYLSSAWRGFFSIQADVDLHSPAEYLKLSLSLWPEIMSLYLDPSRLSIDHQIFLPMSWLEPRVIGGGLLWLVFFLAIGAYFRFRNQVLLPICWLFLSLLPTNSVFPLLDPLAERHFYFGLPAIAWLIGLGAEQAGRKGILLLVPFALLIGACGFASSGRLEQWRSPSVLWLDAHKKAPGKFRVAFNACSTLLQEQDDSVAAIRVLSETLRLLRPGDLRYEEQVQGVNLLVGALTLASRDLGKTPEEVWLAVHPQRDFWSELIFLKSGMDTLSPEAWNRKWQKAVVELGEPLVSPRAKDPRWVFNSLELLRAEQLVRSGKDREALKAYEHVVLPFGETHFPYWNVRVELGDLYMKAGRDEEGVRQYELAAFQYKVFKRFPYSLQLKIYGYYQKRGDWSRAADAIGEVVRVRTDDPQLRRLYADLLLAQQNRNAMRQSREAQFYERNGISALDEREFLKP